MKNSSQSKLSKTPREGMRRGVAIIPNLLTTANLLCGFLSVVHTLSEDFVVAAWFVVLAGLFDFLDGRVARLTNTTSDFGLEYDSLSDLTAFCMAPSVLIYNWSLSEFGKFGIAASFLFFASGALRLARFNVQVSGVEKNRFQGLPTPAAAACLISYVIFSDYIFGPGKQQSYLLPVITTLLAILMVSNVKYRSFKELNRRASFLFLICIVGILVVIAARPEIMMFVFAVSYASVGVIEWIWKSPQKLRSFRSVVERFFEDLRDDGDDDDQDASGHVKKPAGSTGLGKGPGNVVQFRS
jgi:CDP-diacylglycerol--serine O-phosphatidyltransferase